MIDRFGLLPEAAKYLFAVTDLKLKAQPLGIRKLEAGSQDGRILFAGEPKIDPSHIIHLIQTRPQEFKLEGGDKIRFYRNMEQREQRMGQVAAVLDEIAG
jgi:transcription-repair coupling factor (superfamily II helicase)